MQSLKSDSDSKIQADENQQAQVRLLRAIGGEVSANTERRKIWLELLSVISAGLQRDPNLIGKSPKELPYNQRTDFHFTQIDSDFQDDLSKYVDTNFKAKYEQETRDRLTRLGISAQPAANAQDPKRKCSCCSN